MAMVQEKEEVVEEKDEEKVGREEEIELKIAADEETSCYFFLPQKGGHGFAKSSWRS